MKNIFGALIFVLLISACNPAEKSADQHIQNTIEHHGGDAYESLNVEFKFRDKFYKLRHVGGNFQYERIFKDLADEAYETMDSAEAAFKEHIQQLKDDDPDAQETLDIFLNELESANRSYGEFLRMAVVALKDTLNEAKHNAIKEDNFDEIEQSADQLLKIGRADLKTAKRTRRKDINAAKRQFKLAKVRLANAKSKAEIKLAKQQLKAAVAAHEGGDKREIKQLKLDVQRAKAERKAELQLAKQDLDQAKFDLKNSKDKEAIRVAKAEVKAAKDMIKLAQLKTEAFEVTENMLNESL